MQQFLIIYLCLVTVFASTPKKEKRYRPDYVYNEKTDAFYNLHIDGSSLFMPRVLCEAEGAKLMVPESQQDLIQLHTMFKKFPDLGEYIYVGNDGENHESAEEQPIIDLTDDSVTESAYEPWVVSDIKPSTCTVVNRQAEILKSDCKRKLPFMCKVDAKDAPFDENCNVYSTEYQYINSVGSCYKVSHSLPYTWDHAYDECETENAHLVILNSEAEMLVVKDLMNAANVTGLEYKDLFYAGFRAQLPLTTQTPVFETILRQPLDEAGYNSWSENEPNNVEGIEMCGALSKLDGKLNDVYCSHRYPFICEKEVPPRK